MADKTIMRKRITAEAEWDVIEEDVEVDVTPDQMKDVARAGPEIVIFRQTDSGPTSNVFLFNGQVRSNLAGDVLDRARTLYKVTCTARHSCTVDFEVYKNQTELIATVSLSNVRKRVASLAVELAEGDELSTKIVGTANSPTCRLFCKGSTS
jgi:hypothetical protein